eukprot:scaffold268542_cov39-Prasinocladus_malaysianus.AAC.1
MCPAVALGFALAQSVGQLTYLKPFVEDFNTAWLAEGTFLLTGGAMTLVYIAETISKLKLGNGTSILIFASIASSVPSSIGAAITQSSQDANVGTGSLTQIAILMTSKLGLIGPYYELSTAQVAYAAAFVATTLGIVYVQEAERRIPINYASRFKAGNLSGQSYLPFK